MLYTQPSKMKIVPAIVSLNAYFKSYATTSGDKYESLRKEVIDFIPYIVLDDITSKKRLLNSHIQIYHLAKNRIKT